MTAHAQGQPHRAAPDSWEAAWAPYDQVTYAAALSFLRADDFVLDIGAGDLRFAGQAAPHVQHIYAIERRFDLLRPLDGVSLICADARQISFPPNVTAAVLLMRHCTHTRLYIDKLKAVGCARLITNARWGMDVECIDLHADRLPYHSCTGGWYACDCGQVGFIPHSDAPIDHHTEVTHCSHCDKGRL